MINQEIEMQEKKAYHKPEMEVVFIGLHEPLMEDEIPVVLCDSKKNNC